MPTTAFGFQTISDSASYNFETLVNGAIQSIDDRLPHRYVASLTELNALTGAMHPNGQIAVLTATNGGLYAGALFVRAFNQWRFAVGEAQNLATFVGNLTANVKTMPGATIRDGATNTSQIFTTTTGNAEILIGGNSWTNISYPSGYSNPGFGYPLGYRLVPGGAQLRGTIKRTNGKAIAKGTTLSGLIPAPARPTSVVYPILAGTTDAVCHAEIKVTGDVLFKAMTNRASYWYGFDQVFISQT